MVSSFWRNRASADRRATLRGGLIGVAAAAVLIAPTAARCGCQGRDLLADMRANAPTDYAKIDKAAGAMPFGDGRLFRVTRPGLAPSFLFGTIHVADARLANLSSQQSKALASSRTVALETLDIETGVSSSSTSRAALGASPSERASTLLSPDAFGRLRALTLHRGFPAILADRLKASALAFMLDLPACAERGPKGVTFLDAEVLASARSRHLSVHGLESTAEQVLIADTLSNAEKSALLTAVLAQSQQAESVVETTVTVYLQGRIGLLLAWTTSPRPIPGMAQAGIPPAFLDRIISRRTSRMRDRMMPLLAKGSAFIAIGATHIPGQDGLAALLVDAGFTVEKVE